MPRYKKNAEKDAIGRSELQMTIWLSWHAPRNWLQFALPNLNGGQKQCRSTTKTFCWMTNVAMVMAAAGRYSDLASTQIGWLYYPDLYWRVKINRAWNVRLWVRDLGSTITSSTTESFPSKAVGSFWCLQAHFQFAEPSQRNLGPWP